MKKKLLIYFLGIIALTLIFGFVLKEYIPDSINFFTKYSLKIIYRLFLAFILVLLIIKYKLLPKKIFWKQNIIIIPLIAVSIYLSQKKISNYTILNNIELDKIEHLLFFLTCLSIGLFEELLFRVFIFKYALKYSFFKGSHKSRIIKSIAFTSILFGITHVVNLLNHNYDTISVFNQILVAISLGIILQSIYYRFNSILLVVFIHAIFNYLGSFEPILLNITAPDVLTINDFYRTAIFLILLNILLVLPISSILIRKKLTKEEEY